MKVLKAQNSIYIDVGANHPTSISNTYLLYRRGMQGITIEPNQELVALHRRVRPRDNAIAIGCGNSASVKSFYQSVTPVLSSFERNDIQENQEFSSRILRTGYLPVLPLDLVVESIYPHHPYVALLTIDTEGQDYDVLLGATNTLKQTLLICIEANNLGDIERYTTLLREYQFEEVKQFGCNVIFQSYSPLLKHIRSAKIQ